MSEPITPLQKLDRLRDQEKAERDERRGLETRASASIAALLIATGLAINSHPAIVEGYAIAAGILVALAFLASFYPLIGLHTVESSSVYEAVKEAIRANERPVLPYPADNPADELERQHRRAQKLVEANVTAVSFLRLAGLLSVLAAYSVLSGLALA
ncbi:MAG TPA: hypothetical protein VK501_09325 [Baekduia sp.]|uniref:hypothetical protein n=1 Tax=Baekduia sp. TaxID=2600305 RepID=UPI002C49823A|nr:hypothetical protein [Baekduia sp.]HMJ34107.1 hypothetical protein [Baekduia sp.]